MSLGTRQVQWSSEMKAKSTVNKVILKKKQTHHSAGATQVYLVTNIAITKKQFMYKKDQPNLAFILVTL